MQRYVTQSKLKSLNHYYLLIKAYFSNKSHNAYKNADGNSKFNTTKVNPWKVTLWKQPIIAKDEINVSVILANKPDVKAKNFIIPISFYGN